MISTQKHMLTLFCLTFVLATLMTISHYGSSTGAQNGRYTNLPSSSQSLPQSLPLSSPSPPSPSPSSSSPPSLLPSSSSAPSSLQTLFKSPPQQPYRSPPPQPLQPQPLPSSSLSSTPSSSQQTLFKASSRLPPPSSSSSSSSPSSSTSVITNSKHSSSPVDNFDYHSVNESSSPSPSAISRNETSNQTMEEQRFKGYFTDDEISLTRQFLIEKVNLCDNDKGASQDLLILVNSAVGNFEARQAIRETWGKFAVERGSLLLFLVGASRDSNVNEKIRKEDQQYSDILQGAYIDSYYNLTLKTMSMMKWVSDNCDKVKFVLKVDDDMFINMQLLVDFCETRSFTKSIIGHIGKKWKPHRDSKSKWYVSQSVFNGTYFPNFATGPCYMFSGDVSKPLSDQSYKMKPLHLEDVFMTGIVAEAAKIRRLNYSLMKNVRVKVTPCNFKRFMTSHKHTPQEIVALWNQVYDEMDKPCETSKPTAKSTVPAKVTKAKVDLAAKKT